MKKINPFTKNRKTERNRKIKWSSKPPNGCGGLLLKKLFDCKSCSPNMLLAIIYFKENELSSCSSYNQLTKPKKVIATLIFSATGNIGEPCLFFNSLWINNKTETSSSLVPIRKPLALREMFLGKFVYNSICMRRRRYQLC